MIKHSARFWTRSSLENKEEGNHEAMESIFAMTLR